MEHRQAEGWIVFYHEFTYSKIWKFRASRLPVTVRDDRAVLEILFVYIVAGKMGVPTSWITLRLPDQLPYWLRIGCEPQVFCTISHPLGDIYADMRRRQICVVCGDTPEAAGAERWHHGIDACTRCGPCDLCSLCRVLLPRVDFTLPYREQTVLCLFCVNDREGSTKDLGYIQLSGIQQRRLDALEEYWARSERSRPPRRYFGWPSVGAGRRKRQHKRRDKETRRGWISPGRRSCGFDRQRPSCNSAACSAE